MALPPGGYRLCPQCGQRKAPSEFGRNAANEDGYQHWCKACHREYDHERRETRKVPGGTPVHPTTRLQLVLPTSVKDRLRRRAAIERKTMSRLAVEAIHEYLKRKETA